MEDIPSETWVQILARSRILSIPDVLNFCEANPTVAPLCESGYLWNELFRVEFGREEFDKVSQALSPVLGPNVDPLLRLIVHQILVRGGTPDDLGFQERWGWILYGPQGHRLGLRWDPLLQQIWVRLDRYIREFDMPISEKVRDQLDAKVFGNWKERVNSQPLPPRSWQWTISKVTSPKELDVLFYLILSMDRRDQVPSWQLASIATPCCVACGTPSVQIQCAYDDHGLYCSPECQLRDWVEGGHVDRCGAALLDVLRSRTSREAEAAQCRREQEQLRSRQERLRGEGFTKKVKQKKCTPNGPAVGSTSVAEAAIRKWGSKAIPTQGPYTLFVPLDEGIRDPFEPTFLMQYVIPGRKWTARELRAAAPLPLQTALGGAGTLFVRRNPQDPKGLQVETVGSRMGYIDVVQGNIRVDGGRGIVHLVREKGARK